VRYAVDAGRWPRAAALVQRTLQWPAFQALARFEDCLLRIPVAQQRDALAAVGAPLTVETMATEVARKGVARG
jgi:glutathione S-transferase